MSKKQPMQVFERQTADPVYTPRQARERIADANAGSRRLVDDFVGMVRDLSGEDARQGFAAYVALRGWKHGGLNEYARLVNGKKVRLQSAGGRAIDPVSWSAINSFRSFERLAAATRNASDETILALQTAFEAGSGYTEFIAHARRVESVGRPNLEARRIEALRDVAEGVLTGRPLKYGESLWDRVADKSLVPGKKKYARTKGPNLGTLENLLSKFRRQYPELAARIKKSSRK